MADDPNLVGRMRAASLLQQELSRRSADARASTNDLHASLQLNKPAASPVPRPAGTVDGWYGPVGAVLHLLATAAYRLLLF